MASSKPGNLADRMKHLLDTAKLADAYFLVGDGKELLSAHKNILVSASEVFEAMFRFDSQNGKAENVEVPDVEAEAFKVMLSFIYADDLSELNGENAMAVLCAADKYGIDGLIGHCVQIPIQNLPNVFLAHAKARLFHLERLWHRRITEFSKGNRGTLAMEIEKLSEFAQEKVGTRRFSDAVQMKGMPWKILAKINAEKDSTEKCLGFYLLCFPPKNDGNWSCECSATLRIVSQKNGTEDLTTKCDHVFNKESNSWGFISSFRYFYKIDGPGQRIL
ncbi:hypothetical protein niasHT_028865 [Heterodera trifolii]|uniref:BTB domain-containing protein n=1 Tax=Heterodera trifolii TaxID=157864 RepID=A0ABD2KQN6_9BILA